MKEITVNYDIDSIDWSCGEDDRQKCVDALGAWFEGLSLKTQLSIYYAQRCANILQEEGGYDPWNAGCPVLQQVHEAEDRVLKQYAPWVNGENGPQTGFNFSLYITGVGVKELEKGRN